MQSNCFEKITHLYMTEKSKALTKNVELTVGIATTVELS